MWQWESPSSISPFPYRRVHLLPGSHRYSARQKTWNAMIYSFHILGPSLLKGSFPSAELAKMVAPQKAVNNSNDIKEAKTCGPLVFDSSPMKMTISGGRTILLKIRLEKCTRHWSGRLNLQNPMLREPTWIMNLLSLTWVLHRWTTTELVKLVWFKIDVCPLVGWISQILGAKKSLNRIQSK